MEISQFSTHYKVRKITEADLEQVLALYQTNPLYFEYFPPLPSLESLANDLVECPPGKELSDKYFLGFWDKDQLLSVLDLIDGYPTEDTAYIGLFMVDSKLADQGLGSKIIAELLSQLATHFKKGASRLCRKQSSGQSFLVQSWILSNWRGQRVGWKNNRHSRTCIR
ncbi:GNAT family N-acetyltransferase [Streptococcus suis]|uniref:GNAT family N-acetyltransferase n=1 Tax=Streptococcus suis TaxID=1307 RepID=UPI0028C413F7|nr:GNAT family N-acetyltransferase [Streptococcus suis]WNO79123.1 GNAT family N-acetyltransferase [Streptococcus suis]WNO83277.1 GNAT family N-acetyltransferase [Streptococcus suis]